MDRVDQGLEPACVTKCVTKCLHFGKPSLKSQSRRERHARQVADFD
jgi:Fe-S-cluster-containing dehydrogenase component